MRFRRRTTRTGHGRRPHTAWGRIILSSLNGTLEATSCSTSGAVNVPTAFGSYILMRYVD